MKRRIVAFAKRFVVWRWNGRLKEYGDLLRKRKELRFHFIEAHGDQWPVSVMCRVLRVGALKSGEMPSKDSEQPYNEEKADFLDDLSRTMVTARKVLSDSGGRITMRRLNKRDYQNSIENLRGADSARSSFPMMAPAQL